MLPDLNQLKNEVATDAKDIQSRTKILNLPHDLQDAIRTIFSDATFTPAMAKMTIQGNITEVPNSEILLACLSIKLIDGANAYFYKSRELVNNAGVSNKDLRSKYSSRNKAGEFPYNWPSVEAHINQNLSPPDAIKIKDFILNPLNTTYHKGLGRTTDWFEPIVPYTVDLRGDYKAYVSVLAYKLRDVPNIYQMARDFVDGLAPAPTFEGLVKDILPLFIEEANSTGLIFDREFVGRYIASLQAKRFVIFTGLSGSGKTQLATAFAKWACPDDEDQPYYELIAVGANWTGREHIFGYPDALDPTHYVTEKALELMLRAQQRPEQPHFLILDEMNLSHVERYFADVLAAMESGLPISLHAGAKEQEIGIPKMLDRLPENLFIIGTVNVDETTYMFSPKVLDRALTMEFRARFEDIEKLLGNPQKPDTDAITGKGEGAGNLIVERSRSPFTLDEEILDKLKSELRKFFDVLEEQGAEFAFRTAYEITRFVYSHKETFGDEWTFEAGMDAAIIQKLLPRLHGSQDRLEPVLKKLLALCFDSNTSGDNESRTDAKYVLSADKIRRMLRAVRRNRFTSFAEN